ncbi:MAG TPA: hypothetical protein VFQ53_43635 [Kofleriaceae bacterium]|nr:hypothetical protein [Kofleriaceae bacterium]
MRALLLVGLAACTKFEDPNIVIDTRVLAMKATVPDQIVDVDLANPQDPVELLDQLVPTTMCALVADPNFDRPLRYSLTLCVLNNDERCREDGAKVVLAQGLLGDPDTTVPEPQMCGTVEPDGNLLGIVLEALDGDVLQGLGGVDYGVALRVGGDGVDPALDLFAGKTLRVSPRIPAARTANTNPRVDHFDAAKDGVDPQPLPMGRCVDQTAPLEIVPTQRVRITPVEPDGAREVYVVPTIDGKQETFTESLTYQWLAGGGSYSSGFTGGPRDVTGNPPPLFSDFRAPAADEIDGVTDIPIWIVQRDERLGAEWYESCIRVVPE